MSELLREEVDIHDDGIMTADAALDHHAESTWRCHVDASHSTINWWLSNPEISLPDAVIVNAEGISSASYQLKDMANPNTINELISQTSNLKCPEDPIPSLSNTSHPPNQYTLLAKIITDRELNIHAFKNTLTKAWGIGNTVSVNIVEKNTLAFVFEKEEHAKRILAQAPWSFRGNLVALQEWPPDLAFADIEIKKSQFWIQVHNLPVIHTTQENAIVIGNSVGKFIKADLAKESFKWRKALRIRVELDINITLKDRVPLRCADGKEILVEIRYEKLGDFCYVCDSLAHKIQSCPNPIDPKSRSSPLPFGPWMKGENVLVQNPHIRRNDTAKNLTAGGTNQIPNLPSQNPEKNSCSDKIPDISCTNSPKLTVIETADRVGKKNPQNHTFSKISPNEKVSATSPTISSLVINSCHESSPMLTDELEIDKSILKPPYDSKPKQNNSNEPKSYKPNDGPNPPKKVQAKLKPAQAQNNAKPIPSHEPNLPNCNIQSRKRTADDPSSITINPTKKTKVDPVVLIGDFNAIVSQSEKKGGRSFASSSSNPFLNDLNNLNLLDLGFTGNPFTWSNRRGGDANIQLRLDRAVANPDWSLLYPYAIVHHLPAIKSDHCPLLLHTIPETRGKFFPFRFEDMWTRDPSCHTTILESWNSLERGSPTFQLHSRLKNLRYHLIKWNKVHFGNCQERINIIRSLIERANRDDALEIKRIMSIFEVWSGQIANASKSFVHFSGNASEETKTEILNILNMTECTHRAKHLGLPFCKPKSRAVAFRELSDKMTKKLASWKISNLSQAARLVLIKSVAQALPLYHMATYLLPRNLSTNLDRIMMRFWWGAEPDKSPMALKNWDSICLPKDFGGLGLRKMHDANLAMMAKITWKVAVGQDEVWVKMFQARYLRNTNFLEFSNCPSDASWIWKDVIRCKSIILKGGCFKVTSNSPIRIWEDPWIPTIDGFKPVRPPNLPFSAFYVRDLMDDSRQAWDINKCVQIFSPDIVREIQKIYIPQSVEHQSLVWTPDKSGKLSSKSAYKIILQPRLPNSKSKIDVKIWKLRAHDRHKLFIWKAIHDILPTRGKISLRFQIPDINCLFCGEQVETRDHIFIQCPYATRLWFTSHWNLRLDYFKNLTFPQWFNVIHNNSNGLFQSEESKYEFLLYWIILNNLIWRNRNAILHGKPVVEDGCVLREALKNWNEHKEAQISKSILRQNNGGSSEWTPPARQFLKVNTDITFHDGKSAGAMVVRNARAAIVFAETWTSWEPNPTVAEAKAIKKAMMCMDSKNIAEVIFESDSLLAVAWISGCQSETEWNAKSIIEEARKLWKKWPRWKVKKIHREANCTAHEIAKWALSCEWNNVIAPDQFPSFLSCFHEPPTFGEWL
ncbi:hypothetical protein BUALT_Bualt10G0064800 [Buddleja alternifolia]|uniref:Uncharacterized protein n=1 Tax=Buddleja alternifolia TaxID=168488 RepID=A0AAV6WXA8_9LAMI|nr:hypothetical protein BUALT_Bualt10G0064800 [Buddleja alternifolia]